MINGYLLYQLLQCSTEEELVRLLLDQAPIKEEHRDV